MEVKGRNLSEGIPRSFTISSNEILEALTDPLNQIVSSVKIALEQTPPELGADIAERGMMLTGGGHCCATSIACSRKKPACRCSSRKIRSPASYAVRAWRSSAWTSWAASSRTSDRPGSSLT